MVSVEQANGVLAQIQDAGSGRAVTELSWIDQVRVEGSRVVFRLALPGFAQGQRPPLLALRAKSKRKRRRVRRP